MTRFSPAYLLLLFVLPLVWACGGTAATTNNEAATAEPETPPAEVEPLVAEAPSGDHFTIHTLNDSIKSPRKEMSGMIGQLGVAVNYGSPAVNGRTIYGDLVPYDKVWRTGANEATQISFKTDVLLGEEGVAVPAGTYALFTMPASKDDWTIIINEGADLWGAYDYQEAQDVARVAGVATPNDPPAERMDFSLGEDEVRLHWDDLVVSFKVAAAGK
ncbi:MAG: DUF2911 domain-containing protein [Bacteroidota bacterium]